MKQLTLDGREVELGVAKGRPLTESQREILRTLRHAGAIRPLNAGRIVHAHRQGSSAERHVELYRSPRQHGCCKWASSDGWSALRRPERRGLVRHVARGLWVAP